MKSLELYLNTIEKFFENVTTEVVVGDIVSSGLDKKFILTEYEGQHKRAFSRDLENVSLKSFKNQEDKLIFYLNRDGLYDALPEALFHDSAKKTSAIRADLMVDEYHVRKKEEHEARKFFIPLEHEFFFTQVDNELDERNAFSVYTKYNFDDAIANYFDIDINFPEEIKNKLMCFLPVAHRFKGNFEMITKIISLLTNSPVIYQLKNESGKCIREAIIGTAILGHDLTTSDSEPYTNVRINFEIGPVEKHKLYNFLPQKMLDKLLSYIFSTFIPVEYSVSYCINITPFNSSFMLNETDTASARLAYTTTL